MNYRYNGGFGGSSNSYTSSFWKTIKGVGTMGDWEDSYDRTTSSYALPYETHNKYEKALEKESLFRKIATTKTAYGNCSRIHAKESTDLAQWVPEGGNIPIYDGIRDFTIHALNFNKLAAFTRLTDEFALDATFDIENYIVDRFAKLFSKAEDNAFINGDGDSKPIGILNSTAGAQVGIISASKTEITFDEVVKLFFSVKNEYRLKAVWLMNDETATVLRLLKDENGNYIWNQYKDTILGRPVYISNYIPSIAPGAKIIAFGDFSYYWIVDRDPIRVRTLKERFAINGQLGFLANEYLDAKLIREDAIKVLQMKSE